LRPAVFLLLLPLLFAAVAQAQDIRYVSDKQYIPLRSGPGGEYRITHKGIPSGTGLTVARTSSDDVWAEITTDRGTSGWIRTQYLMEEVPAQNKLTAAIRRADQATEKSQSLATEMEVLQAEHVELINQLTSNDSQLGSVSEQLNQLKQISGNAVNLDADNRRLAETTENLRSEVEMLQAENLRLQDNLESEDFLNGALAVLLGVIIALVAPRLVPKRRKSSSWA
jgi:SH3 domain protein